MMKLKTSATVLSCILCLNVVFAQSGYYDAPFKRYEAEQAMLIHASSTEKSYQQTDLQSEASDQVCVDLSKPDASAEWQLSEAADGLVVRYAIPKGESANIAVYNGQTKITSIALSSKWTWEYLWNNGDPNNTYVKNKNPRKRFDEVRVKLPVKISSLKLVRESGNIWLDFVELEQVPLPIEAPADAVVYSGNGSDLQAFIDSHGAKTIYIPTGTYNIDRQIYFGVNKTKLQGAGMWYTQLNFTVTNANNGGLRADARDICYSDLFLTTEMATRTNAYSGIQGVYTSGSIIKNIWVEHFAAGAWIAQYGGVGPTFADGFILNNCRFRNSYADGINLCKGTSNAMVEHCNFRNNGDDAMAVWCAEGLECINNTFRYNTVENVWRAAGIGLYGGKDNKFYNIIIKDNLEIGITVNNFFAGVGFNAAGMHDFRDITIIGGGTFNDTENNRVGAINITCSSIAGTKIQNLHFNKINVIDSKCDAIRISKNSGNGIFNVQFENLMINGTGKEYPYNNINNTVAQRGYAVIFEKYPTGNASYCKLNYTNLGGNVNNAPWGTTQKGTFTWNELNNCDLTALSGIKIMPADTSVEGGRMVQLIPQFEPKQATNQIVSYQSDNPQVATVDYAGLVKTLSKGTAIITVVSQEGNFKSTSTIHVTSNPLTVYKIKNRWQNSYLYDDGDLVKYAPTVKDNTFMWELVDHGSFKQIKNYSTGDLMQIDNRLGYVQCTGSAQGFPGSDWSLITDADGFVRIKSEWIPDNYIHVEKLQEQAWYGPINQSWWSAMWILEPIIVTSSPVLTIENSAKIYPNPSGGVFKISANQFAKNETVSITIYCLSGQALFNKSVEIDENGHCETVINTGKLLSPGNYLVIARGNQNMAKAQLVISK